MYVFLLLIQSILALHTNTKEGISSLETTLANHNSEGNRGTKRIYLKPSALLYENR